MPNVSHWPIPVVPAQDDAAPVPPGEVDLDVVHVPLEVVDPDMIATVVYELARCDVREGSPVP